MKKILLTTIFAFATIFVANAQNDTVLYIVDRPNDQVLCIENEQSVIIYAQENCNEFHWTVQNQPIWNENPLIITPQLGLRIIDYDGCDFHHSFGIRYRESKVPNEFYHENWKRQYSIDSLVAVGYDSVGYPFNYSYLWSTGETTRTIEVTETGTYTCEISELCGSTIRTFIVKDNMELYRASVDLETNLNKTTWQVTEEQAEYISEVKVYRDGLLVGTAPYQEGYFLDAIGSDNAARNYQIVGVTPEGEDCPIASYQKGTIHTTYYQDVNNNLNMTWNIPYVEEGAQGTLTYFQICKYDPNTEELTVVDQVNASITDYTCGVNQFDGGYAVIAAVFNDGKGLEELSFSNLTTDILGIGENGGNAFRIYPNPAKDRVTVEGTGLMTITNALGQTILTKEIDGKTTIDLPQGMYFVKLGNETQKIVVE